MIEMDDAIVEAHHDAGFPIEWEESSSLTHPEADVEVSKRRKPSEFIVNSIAKMVMAIREAVDKRWYPDLYAMSGPPRA